jgi:hypothetical protein
VSPKVKMIPVNAKGKKMIIEPTTCQKCGEKGHMQMSSNYPLNRKEKRGNYWFFSCQIRDHFIINAFNLLVGSRGNLERMLQKPHKENIAPHRDQLEKKYYGIVQDGSKVSNINTLEYNNIFHASRPKFMCSRLVLLF